MDFVAQQRFQSLRKHLDQLHYCQPFSKFSHSKHRLTNCVPPPFADVESSALVERLLNEVLQTTEAFQKLKNENAVIANEAGLNGQSMVPLQKENERLVKENNDLHLQLI